MNAWRDIVERYFPLSTTATVEARSGGAPAAEDADEEAAASDARERAKLFGETAVDRMRLQLEEQRLTCVLRCTFSFLLFPLFLFLDGSVHYTVSNLCVVFDHQLRARAGAAATGGGEREAGGGGGEVKGGEWEGGRERAEEKEKEEEGEGKGEGEGGGEDGGAGEKRGGVGEVKGRED